MKIKLFAGFALICFIVATTASRTSVNEPNNTKEQVISNTLRIEKLEESYTRLRIDAGFMSFTDQLETVTATGNPTFDPITNATNDLFDNTFSVGKVVVDGDSMVVNCDCKVVLNASFSFNGGNTSTYAFRMLINGVSVPDSGFERDMTSSDTGSGGFNYVYQATSGDSFRPPFSERAGSTDPTFVSGSITLLRL
jgi:hypothetical protein